MDVPQISIKINQTNQVNKEKSNSTTQTEASVISFDQILAMFNSLGRSTELVGKSVPTSVENPIDSKQIDPEELKKEDLSNLVSILTAWAAAIQQVQNPPVPTTGLTTEKQSTPVVLSDSAVVSNLVSQLQQVTAEGNKALAQWLQKVDGHNQTTTLDPAMLLQGLTQLIGELQAEEKLNPADIPIDIGNKIKIIMNELKKENKLDVITPFYSQSNKTGLLFDDKKPDVNPETKIGLSLDKNLAMFSFIPDPVKPIGGGNSLVRAAASTQVEDLTKSSGMTIMVNQPLQGSNGMGESNIESLPPNLTVSEFTPEVSEWINRFMRITNGQSGSTAASFSLYPEHLGHIEIKVTSEQGQIVAQIVTDTSLAKEALQGQLQHLRQSLQQQGLLVQKLEIIQQTPVSMDMNQANLSFSQGGSRSSQQQRSFTLAQEESKKQEEADQLVIGEVTFPISYGGAVPMKATNIDFTA